LKTNETVAVFEDSQWLGSFARFSPDGRWISYISPTNQEIQAYHLESGRSVRIPSSTGEPASWGKDSNTLLITEIDFSGERYSLYVYKVDLTTTEVSQLSGEIEISDGWPTWSPDGEWIAFNRKLVRAPMGKQLWLMRPDGSEMTQLTNEPELHHGPPSWSPDGRWLVFQRYALAEPNAEPGVWLFDVNTQELHRLVEPGTQPAWLP
jgi:TolB protein